MRLTLRTILAYLDDVLEPAQAREIGEKISESKEAAALMSRIKEVIRRRRIGAPELAGPGSGPDPNLVADYLENLLGPGDVVELERLCQASDLHLAEVAACHKILSLVVGHPIDVPDEMRERMYALGSAKAPQDSSDGDGLPAMSEGMTGVQTEPVSGLPEYLLRQSFLQKYGVACLVGLVTLMWTALIFTDKSLFTTRSEVAAKIEQPAAVAQAEESPAPGPNVNVPQVVPAAPKRIVPPPPVPMESVQVVPSLARTAPMEIPPMPQPEEMNRPANEPRPAIAAVAPPELPFHYDSGDEFVIKKLAVKDEWMWYPNEMDIEVDDELASPEPFQNAYKIDNTVSVILEPGTRIRRLRRTADTVLQLELNRGRLLLTRSAAAAEPVSVGLRAAGQDWVITLLEPETRCAVELNLPNPQGPPPHMGEMLPEGGISVVEGRVRLSSADHPAVELGANEGLAQWPAHGGALVLDPTQGVPDWARPEGVLITPASKQLAKAFREEFLADRTIAQCIGPATRDRQAGISSLAVRTLALIDQYPRLVASLQADHQESRLDAIQGLQQWLGQNPENEEKLREELERLFPSEKVDPLVRLLWGFNVNDARSPETSQQLLNWMKDDQIAIREISFKFVSDVVGKTYDYLPMAPTAERRAALNRWEDHLKRGGGSFLPALSTPAN